MAIIEAAGSITLGLPGNSLANLQTRKVVLLVPGNVTINSNIQGAQNANPAAMGFLAIIAEGNVMLGGDVGVDPLNPNNPFQWDIADPAYPPHLSAVIYSQGSFTVNTKINQLKIDGGVVAMGGININPGRTSEGPYPAEFVHYNPGMMRILRDVGLRRKVVMEPVP